MDPADLVGGAFGKLVEAMANSVREIQVSGDILGRYPGPGRLVAELGSPSGILEEAGLEGHEPGARNGLAVATRRGELAGDALLLGADLLNLG